MQFTWDALIHRARVYIDDHHEQEDGFLEPADWLTLGNVELAQLRRRWIRSGLIAPVTTDTAFTGTSTALSGVMAILGVAQDYGGGSIRVLKAAQQSLGRAPFWRTAGRTTEMYWQAAGEGDNLTVTLEPASSSSGNYFVRWLPVRPYDTDTAATVDIPYGTDERLVLGMARRSKLVEGSASRQLDGHIQEADEELSFSASGRGGGNFVRDTRHTRTDCFRGPAHWSWY